jgi:Ni/Fe-hydrogenase subunit HybB-like protein
VMCAGIFPAIHIGRPWLAYWLFPIPNQMAMWPNFRSPLLWDVFAVSTYFTVSLLFWYVGMIPDLATLRDRATTKGRQAVYGVLAMGWTGSGRQWHHYERVYLLLAALATPLVLSVHSVVSFDFAASLLPGWHTTIFPPYFVAGAIFGGFAMVVTLLVPVRAFFKLEEIVTVRHLDNMAKIILATGTMVGYSYAMEFFTAWYSGNPTERFVFLNRAFGPYGWAYWTMITCNVAAPQLFWFRRFRQSPWLLMAVAMLVNVGMWFERFVIIVTSLSRDFLPSSWGYFRPTAVDLLTLAGSFGLFLSLFLLFLRFVPMFAMAEVKSVMPAAGLHRGPHRGHGQYWGEIPHQHESSAPSGPAPSASVPAGVIAPEAGRTLLAEFDDPGKLLAASEQLRDAGFTRWDVHTPIPLHGLDEAMGIRMSKLPWLVLGGGAAGLAGGLGLQWFTNAFDYPFLISGKPFFGLPAAVPVTFELTILLASLGAVGGLFVVNGWPRLHNPLFASERFLRVTTDRYFVSVDQADPLFDPERTARLLASLGAVNLETVGE